MPYNSGQAAFFTHVQAAVAAAVGCPLCPHVTPEVGIRALVTAGRPRLPRVRQSVLDEARQLVEDQAWREAALAWIDAYWARHGHGPAWEDFQREPSLWAPGVGPQVPGVMLFVLWRRGYVDGTRTPFGLKVRRSRPTSPPGSGSGDEEPR